MLKILKLLTGFEFIEQEQQHNVNQKQFVTLTRYDITYLLIFIMYCAKCYKHVIVPFKYIYILGNNDLYKKKKN